MIPLVQEGSASDAGEGLGREAERREEGIGGGEREGMKMIGRDSSQRGPH